MDGVFNDDDDGKEGLENILPTRMMANEPEPGDNYLLVTRSRRNKY